MYHDDKMDISLTRSGSSHYRDTADNVDMLTSSRDLHREEYQHEGQHTADNIDMLTGSGDLHRLEYQHEGEHTADNVDMLTSSGDLHREEYHHDGEQCCHGAGPGVDCGASS